MTAIPAGPLILERLTDLRPEEACLRAVTEVLGVPHHVFLIAVQDVACGDGATEQVALHDPHDCRGDVLRLNEERLATVRVPGYPDEYVLVIFPFAE
jgi:hypothetical protein